MKSIALNLVMFTCSMLFSQYSLSAQSFAREASISKNQDGSLSVAASSPRPLWQALEAIRLRYGWTIDYEDPQYPSQFIRSDIAGRRMLIGGSFSSQIQEPRTNSISAERRVLTQLIDQYNAQSQIRYRVLQISETRFDIAPTSASLMDQTVEIDSETRSLRGEVDAIMAALTHATGIRAVQGGLIDNGMEQQQVSLKHSDKVSVRQLLNEVLAHSAIQKTWLFTCEPDGDYVGVGIRSTEKWSARPDGTIAIKTILNPHCTSPSAH